MLASVLAITNGEQPSSSRETENPIAIEPLHTFLIVIICLLIAGLNLYVGVASNYISLAVLVVAMAVGFHPYRRTSIGAVSLFSAVTLFIVPTYALLYVDAGVTPAWFALFILVALTLSRLIGVDPILAPSPFRFDLTLLAFCVLVGLLTQYARLPEQVFHAFWGFSVVHLERLHASTGSRVKRLTGLALTLVMVGIYAVVFWGGYGRLILASFALAPILIAVRYETFKLNSLIFGIGAGSLVFLGRVLRFGWSDGVAGLADDSGASPLALSEGLLHESARVFYHEPLWHQWSLLFLQWFPRSVWPTKPVGLNYTLVDVVLGRQGLGEDHSTAVGYFGEHIFLLRDWWLAAAAVLTLLIAATNHLVRKVSKSYAAPNIVFNAWLVTLFWGGMADFGSRVWFSVVPMIVYIAILSRFGRTVSDRGATPRRAADVPALSEPVRR